MKKKKTLLFLHVYLVFGQIFKSALVQIILFRIFFSRLNIFTANHEPPVLDVGAGGRAKSLFLTSCVVEELA